VPSRPSRNSGPVFLTAPAAALAILLLLLTASAAGADDDSIQVENKEVELESIRSEIRDVQSRIEDARKDADSYLKEIQETEKAAARVSARLRDIEESIDEKTARLEQLEKDKTHWEAVLEKRRGNLARQIRIAYKTGHHDFLKLLLNQEEPALVGRMVTYHKYYTRARAEKIRAVKESLDKIGRLQTSINEENARLKDLRQSHVARLEEYKQHRKSRRESIDELHNFIDKQGRELEHLRRNEEELAALLNRLKSKRLAIQAYEDLPPFQSLKGKLDWPVQGRLLNQYGESRKGGRLRSYGVRIAAGSGDDVRAISAGKVVFADWFRNMGLLIIVDHGNDYMSLYGHNERLLKKPGDMVASGEVIAKVGDTGGQRQTGLYFEIRRQGSPLNPSLWCRR